MTTKRKPRAVDITGHRFSRLVVLERAPNLSAKNTRWLCLCDCGATTIVQGGALKNGVQQSCGCLHMELITTHGQDGSRSYLAWSAMKSRCLNPKTKSYPGYGGRGITVCDAWLLFKNFYADMGDAPDGMSLDRRDNDLGYSPDNCRWTSVEVQNNNRRGLRILSYDGREQSLARWAKEFNMTPMSLKSRFNLGWDVAKALTTPIDKRFASRRKK